MDRWVVGIALVFGAYITVNAVIIVLALREPPEIESSYQAEPR